MAVYGVTYTTTVSYCEYFEADSQEDAERIASALSNDKVFMTGIADELDDPNNHLYTRPDEIDGSAPFYVGDDEDSKAYVSMSKEYIEKRIEGII